MKVYREEPYKVLIGRTASSLYECIDKCCSRFITVFIPLDRFLFR